MSSIIYPLRKSYSNNRGCKEMVSSIVWSMICHNHYWYAVCCFSVILFIFCSAAKIQGWKLELSCFSYSIQYRLIKNDIAPDTLSGMCYQNVLCCLHKEFTIFYRKICSICQTCTEVNPSFHTVSENILIEVI